MKYNRLLLLPLLLISTSTFGIPKFADDPGTRNHDRSAYQTRQQESVESKNEEKKSYTIFGIATIIMVGMAAFLGEMNTQQPIKEIFIYPLNTQNPATLKSRTIPLSTYYWQKPYPLSSYECTQENNIESVCCMEETVCAFRQYREHEGCTMKRIKTCLKGYTPGAITKFFASLTGTSDQEEMDKIMEYFQAEDEEEQKS